MVRICAVVGCSNSTKKLDDWYAKDCSIHRMKYSCCMCKPPFFLHTFPTELKDPAGRERWARLLDRVGKKGEAWRPSPEDRVCSIHFIDREPTAANPDPTERLGKDSSYPLTHNGKLSRRHMLTRQLFEVVRKERKEVKKRDWKLTQDLQETSSQSKRRKKLSSDKPSEHESEHVPFESDHSYAVSLPSQCPGCAERDETIVQLKAKLKKLHQRTNDSVTRLKPLNGSS